MRKLFALLSIAFIAMLFSPVFAQNTTSSTVTITSPGGVELIESAISPENSTTAYVLEKLESYAKALEVPIKQLYNTLIKQQLIYSYIWLFAITAFLFISITFTVICYRDEDGEDWWGVPAASWVVMIVLICVGLKDIFTGFVNPEFGAMQDLLYMLK